MTDINSGLFQLPETSVSQMYQVIQAYELAELTTGAIDGTGAFDLLMASVKSQLQLEYEQGRMTGAEYTKAYIATTQAAMQTALQFVMGQSQTYWAAQNAQIQAITGRIAMEAARYNYASMLPEQLSLLTEQVAAATLANTTAQYNIDHTLPVQLGLMTAQSAGATLANTTAQYNIDHTLPAQLSLLNAQVTSTSATAASTQYTLSYLLPAQLVVLGEQADVQRAQTANYRRDGSVVGGVMGAQKDLYAQQIVSYVRDSEVKAAKIFTDAWITQKTIDDGLLPPVGFTNNSVNSVLAAIMANNHFGVPTP